MNRPAAHALVDAAVEARVKDYADCGLGYASACGTLQELLASLLSGLWTPAEVEARLRELARRGS